MESGGEKKNHKWYARIGTPGNYKYFYSQQEVDAYKAKMSGGSTKTAAKSSGDSKGSNAKSSSETKSSTSKATGSKKSSSKKSAESKEQKPNIASVSDTVNNVAKVAGKDKSEVDKVMSLVAAKGWDSPEVAAAVKTLANNNEELGKKMLLHLKVAKTYEDSVNAKKKKTKDKLQHSGIIGMKWGIRRWQNSDGSLTPEGREHYGVGAARKETKGLEKHLNKLEKRGANHKAASEYYARHQRGMKSSREKKKYESINTKKSEVLKKIQDLGYNIDSKTIDYDPTLRKRNEAIGTAVATAAQIPLAAATGFYAPLAPAAGFVAGRNSVPGERIKKYTISDKKKKH